MSSSLQVIVCTFVIAFCCFSLHMGWESLADDLIETEHAGQVAHVQNRPPVDVRTGRGRRPGQTQELKDAVAQQAQALEAARSVRLQVAAPAQFDDGGLDLQALTFCATDLQARLCRFAKQQMSKPAIPDSQNSVAAILEHSSSMSSWKLTAVAVRSNVDTKSVQRDYRRASEALLQSSSLLWQMTLQRILDMLSNESFEGLVLIRKRRYDESPFRLRLQEEADGSLALDSLKAQAVGSAKVMQSELEFAALIRRKAPNHDHYMYQELHGECLAWLHVVDKTSAENIAETQRQIQCSVKLPDHIEDKFKLVCDLVCSDRYTANIAAERSLQSGLTGWVKNHSFCLLHKAAAIQTTQFRLISGHISGLLSVALSMQASGTTALLKELLSQLLSDKLVVRHSPPPVQFRRHQEALHDLFLPIGAHSKSASLRKRQRVILSALMNGDLQDENHVSYYTEDSSINKAMIGAVWVRFAVAALLPHKCPHFNRSKWLGGELCIEWCGLLSSHHNLLEPLVQLWVSRTSSIPVGLFVRKQQQSEQSEAVGRAGWDMLADRVAVVHNEAEAPRSEDGLLDPGPLLDEAASRREQESSDQDPNINWAEFNKANKRKALAWVSCRPGPILVCMRYCMRATLRILFKIVHLASEAFAKQQLAKASRGEAREAAVLEFFSDATQNTFEGDIRELMQSAMAGLPAIGCYEAMRVLAFRMLSVAACSSRQLIWHMVSGSPVALFRTLQREQDEKFALPFCLQDELTISVMALYHNQLESEECSQVLRTLAQHFHLDILDLERNHVRYAEQSKANPFTLGPQPLIHSVPTGSFVEQLSFGGLLQPRFGRMSRAYRALKGTPDFAMFQAQLSALKSESRQLTIQNKVEQESAQEAIASTSDALAPVHEAEGVAKQTQISEQLGSAFVFTPGKPSVAQFHAPADRFVQEIFKPTYRQFARHGVGVNTDLDEAWKERCVLAQHQRAPALDSSHAFRTSTCCQLCFCVHQGEGLKAFRMHTNIVQLLKPHIQAIRRKRKKAGDMLPAEAKKSKPQHPEARRLLDSAMLVLRLHAATTDEVATVTSENAGAAGDAPASGASMSWNRAAQRILVLADESEFPGPTQEFWLHIGYMNHNSKVFTVLPLVKDAACGVHADMVKLVASDQNVRAYRLFEFLKGHIDFEQAWRMSLYKISSTSESLTQAEFRPSFIHVGHYPEMPEMVCWHGWSRKERFYGGGGGGGGSGPGGGRRRRGGGATRGHSDGRPPPGGPADEDEEDDGGGVGFVLPPADDSDGAEAENVVLLDEAKSQSASDLEDAASWPPSDASVADAEGIEQAGPDAVPNFLGVDGLLSEAPAAAAASSSDARVPELEADAVPPAAHPAAGRAGGGVRSGEEIIRVDVAGGRLVYYGESQDLKVFCTNAGHLNCEKKRTVKPGGRKGQGRPIGFLLAWLAAADSFEDASKHVHKCKPTLAQRTEAREKFKTVNGWQALADKERKCGEGEPEEPPSFT
ncbi:unnamed protein product [Symbiodinium sp. CCMP2456]|nr:unnamed protein product [Symbiodinium sp. CCMP2456]